MLNLFLALLLSAFGSENMKKSQQQDGDGVEDNDEEEVKTSMTAAYERLRRWTQFVTARLGALTIRQAPTTYKDVDGGALKATSTVDTACDLAAAVSPDGTPDCRRSSPLPAVLVDCNDRKV